MENLQNFEHKTVLLEEAVEALNIKEDGIYIDGTFGRGGHSRLILSKLGKNGRLIAIDKDPQALAEAKTIDDPRFSIHHGSFADCYHICKNLGVLGKIDGVLLDLGISSPQVDDATRGFSFMKEGPLDMRMDTTKGLTAEKWLENASEKDITYILRFYADETCSTRLGRAIYHYCNTYGVFKTTTELADFIKEIHPKPYPNKHPATRTFQALRVAVNGELDDLKTFLESSVNILNSYGRLAIISFHSIEDRMIKRFFKDQSTPKPIPKGMPIMEKDREQNIALQVIGKRIKPSEEEVNSNPRSRSAVLRVSEKIANENK